MDTLRQRQAAPSLADTGPDAAQGPRAPPDSAPDRRSDRDPSNTARRGHPDHKDDEEDEHHDEIDETKLDSLWWELLRICIPVGLFLWAAIYLMYRANLANWSTSHPIPLPIRGARAEAVSPRGGAAELDKWIEEERDVAWRYLERNIGSGVGADDGVVVASPSRGEGDEPDYYYTWTRDSALTILTFLPRLLPQAYLHPWLFNSSRPTYRAVLRALTSAHTRPQNRHGNRTSDDTRHPEYLVEPLLRAYISSQSAIQAVVSRSGNLWSGGLNEPKFEVNKTAYSGDWGRPQRDGPALRALTLIPYAHYLLDRAYPADFTYVAAYLYDRHLLRGVGSVIKNDLEEVAHGWHRGGFDLWEEVDGHHLFTLLASLRALQAGSILADRLDDQGAAEFYRNQSSSIAHRLPDFWDESRGYWVATLRDYPSAWSLSFSADQVENARPVVTQVVMAAENSVPGRTGLNCAFPLALNHWAGTDDSREAAEDRQVPEHRARAASLEAGSDRSLVTLRKYIKTFQELYEINAGRNWTQGIGVGRYAEDVYDGRGTSVGNPWYICTFAVAEAFYRAHTAFDQRGSITITPLSAPFWSDLLGREVRHDEVWHRARGKGQFDMAAKALRALGDRYLDVGRRYMGDQGRMSEQFSREDGRPVGARDLTWSYAAFISAIRAREGPL